MLCINENQTESQNESLEILNNPKESHRILQNEPQNQTLKNQTNIKENFSTNL